ncbi:SRPBCC domain-containing protein [Cupriavidus basilensis]
MALSLRDVEAVAACMPGATITERVDATHYKGTIVVRLGPATMSFKGDIEVPGLDPAARSLHLAGKGADSTELVRRVDGPARDRAGGRRGMRAGRQERGMTMSGKAAAFGGRMMNAAGDQILKQFAANFAALVQAPQALARCGCRRCPRAGGGRAASRVERPGACLQAMLRDWVRGIFARKAT